VQTVEEIGMLLALKKILILNCKKPGKPIREGRFDDMRSLILQSNFYQNNNATARTRLQAKTSQPGVYTDGLNKYSLLATR
jgi:hypothetical protein